MITYTEKIVVFPAKDIQMVEVEVELEAPAVHPIDHVMGSTVRHPKSTSHNSPGPRDLSPTKLPKKILNSALTHI